MKLKKSLGQNFLKSKEVVNKIIETADLNENDIILEIGPGKGFLTENILGKVKKVIVVEKDNRLINFLNEKFENFIKSGELEIINNDVLNINIENYIFGNYKLIANIPYYITGKVLRKFLSSDEKQPLKIVLMVQKEVAKRIIDKKESLLSLSVKVYGEPKYIKTVKSKYFSPQPKVDSAILLINNISKDFFDKNNIKEYKFFNLLKIGFAHKRKFLINNLNSSIKNKDFLEKIFKKLNIPTKSRSEDLIKEEWKNIVIKLNKI